MPIQKISNQVTAINRKRTEKEKILLIVDGLHEFGVEDIQIEELGCDFFISGCHKWLFGPRGTGLIWGKPSAWEHLIPSITSFKNEAFFAWFNCENLDLKCPKAWQCSPGGFQAYEHRWALGEAFDFHHSLGKVAVQQRIHDLNLYCKERLLSLSEGREKTQSLRAEMNRASK